MYKESRGVRRTASLVGLFAGVDPVAVDVDGLGQIGDGGLEVLHAHAAADEAHVALTVPETHTHCLWIWKLWKSKEGTEQKHVSVTP